MVCSLFLNEADHSVFNSTVQNYGTGPLQNGNSRTVVRGVVGKLSVRVVDTNRFHASDCSLTWPREHWKPVIAAATNNTPSWHNRCTVCSSDNFSQRYTSRHVLRNMSLPVSPLEPPRRKNFVQMTKITRYFVQ